MNAPSSSSRPVAVLRPGRLDGLARVIAGQLRRAFVTAEEASYLWRRIRALAGIKGRPVRARKLPDTLTATELGALLAAAYTGRARDGLIVRTLFESAIRVSELTRLDALDMDVLERTVRVKGGKGNKDRIALIGEDLAQLVRLHLDGRVRGPLFCSNRGTRLSVRRVQGIVKSAAGRARIAHKQISPHSLRHAWATQVRNAGLPLDSVQAQLGHESPRTTLLYSRLAIATRRAEYDRAMSSLAGAGPSSAVARISAPAGAGIGADAGAR